MSWVSFPYVRVPGVPIPRPLVSVGLVGPGGTRTELALLDTGAGVNVLPRSLGTAIGLDWNRANPLPALGGALAGTACRLAQIGIVIGGLPQVTSVFCWTASDVSPLIFGQNDFFHDFDAAFYFRGGEFRIRPAATP